MPGSRIDAKLPSLDGWRALSIVLVLGWHCTYSAGFPEFLRKPFGLVFDGNLGVRMFFIISGFLITWLMLKEQTRTGDINLLNFYARRGLRILPVYFTFLLTLLIFQFKTPFHQSPTEWLVSLTFTGDFFSVGNWTSGHLWSLAVEEQFYLLWPCLFVFSGAAKSLRLALQILLVPVIVAPIARVLSFFLNPPPSAVHLFAHGTRLDFVREHFAFVPAFFGILFSSGSFFNFFDSLALGCLGALVIVHRPDIVRSWSTVRPALLSSVAIAMILVPQMLNHMTGFGFPALTIPFEFTIQGIGILALLLQSVANPWLGFYPLLNGMIPVKIGMLSYSIYIWQQIFCSPPALFGFGNVWWFSFPSWIIAALLTAVISYVSLERPFFRLRAHFR